MRLLRAEWTKLATLRGNGWLLAGVVVILVGLAAAVTLSVPLPHCAPDATSCTEDTTRLSLGGVRLAQVLVVVLAAAAVCTEFENRMSTMTFAATPHRLRVLVAKALTVSAVTAGAGAVAVAGSLALARYTLPYHGFTAARGYPPLSLGDGALWRAGGGTVAYLCLIALMSLGVGAATRSNAATISTVLGLLFLFPLAAAAITAPRWQDRLHKWGPMDAGLAIQNTLTPAPGPVGPWPGLGILALWAAAAVVVGAVAVRFRDA
jgi:ABC-2 type transport system permease protein